MQAEGVFQRMVTDTLEALELTPWRLIWEQRSGAIIAFSAFLVLLIFIMVFKDRIAKNGRLLTALTYSVLAVSFLFVGLFLKAQLTTTNIVIILNGLREFQFPLALYIMEPFIFLSFIFVLFTIVIWGRGLFCGWLCPYGAMTELLSRLYLRFFPNFRFSLPEKVHGKLIYLKYVIFAVIAGASFYSFMLSEYLAEVEPFKTFVLKLNRPWPFVLYFGVVTAASLVVYRAYCRYLCPLGAVLSLPSFLRFLPLVKLSRYELCGTCKICGKTCRYQAIAADGRIDPAECLDCLECQVNFWHEERCPARRKGRRESKAESRSAKGTAALLLIAALSVPASVSAKTLVVGDAYATINEALKKAKDGDIIEVKPGEYRERMRIEKGVTLKGIGNPAIIGREGYIIEVASRGVTVEGFTIRDENPEPDVRYAGIFIGKGADNAVVRQNRLLNVMHAIWSVGARGVRIEENVIEGKKALERNYRGNGIYLTDSQEARIINNRIDSCRDGMYLEVSHDGEITGNEIRNSRYGIHTMWVDRSVFKGNSAFGNLVGIAIMYSRQSEVADNIAAGNQTHGLLLIQTTRTKIAGNVVIGNTKGVFFYNSVFNTLSGNLVMNNSLGLHSWGGSEDNTVTGNSFIQNEVQVKFVAGRNQQWDNNYWSDYLGWDMTGDGTGDQPYESNSVVDHILWRYPAAKLLYASPSFQLLWMLEKQFPLLKVPRVLDTRPAMLPIHGNWRELRTRYPFHPERYYGEIEKLPVTH